MSDNINFKIYQDLKHYNSNLYYLYLKRMSTSKNSPSKIK